MPPSRYEQRSEVHGLTRMMFGGLAAAVVLAVGTACGGDPGSAPSGAGAARPPTTTAASPSAAGPPSTSPPPEVSPTTSSPATPPPVQVALIDRIDRDSVSWTDGTLVTTTLGDPVSSALPGAEHKHTAALAADAMFFAPSNCGANQGDVHLDGHGLGTVPCTKEELLGLGNDIYGDAGIFFNTSGEVSKIAARYHP